MDIVTIIYIVTLFNIVFVKNLLILILILIFPVGASLYEVKCSESTCIQVVLLAMLAQWDTQS